MFKKIIKLIFVFIILNSAAYAESAVKSPVTLNVSFDWLKPTKPFSDSPIHSEKSIILDQQKYAVAFAETQVIDKTPVTLALLVKTIKLDSDHAALQLMLVSYGYNSNSNVISEPKIIMSNGQTSELKLNDLTIKISGKWS